ncbi:uncharacterized protein LOC123398751 isoform X1 [Hordeum vulgare subsp. vulgare]|uniref:uncharacterized protein LOC123398751 isoform X1 n=1 Tax=Hordeum vulgare subsp. vulgare TaxID=112509 RepID=UPI000B47BDA3|nr:uncharacterized protein LOC123398751 isoform X1 [Hordeum vulgare subsp. vulgare]
MQLLQSGATSRPTVPHSTSSRLMTRMGAWVQRGAPPWWLGGDDAGGHGGGRLTIDAIIFYAFRTSRLAISSQALIRVKGSEAMAGIVESEGMVWSPGAAVLRPGRLGRHLRADVHIYRTKQIGGAMGDGVKLRHTMHGRTNTGRIQTKVGSYKSSSLPAGEDIGRYYSLVTFLGNSDLDKTTTAKPLPLRMHTYHIQGGEILARTGDVQETHLSNSYSKI